MSHYSMDSPVRIDSTVVYGADSYNTVINRTVIYSTLIYSAVQLKYGDLS